MNLSVQGEKIKLKPKKQGKSITIIKYGPPASGKGSLFVKNKIKEILKTRENIPTQTNLTTFQKTYTTKMHKNRSLVNINMNNPIESNPEYRNATMEQKRVLKEKYGNSYLNALTTNNTKNMYNLYSKHAQSIYQLATKELEGANTNGADVIIETTGQHGLPNWLKIRKDREYHIIFPIISFETLWKRYKNRANKGPVFRILSTKEQLREVYIKSYTEFLKNYLENKRFKVYVLDNEGNNVKFLNTNSGEARNKIENIIKEAKSNRRNNKSNN